MLERVSDGSIHAREVDKGYAIVKTSLHRRPPGRPKKRASATLARAMASDWMQNWREITAGPEYLRGISREPDYPDDQNWSDAIVDPLMESLGRLVRSCSLLEIALTRPSAHSTHPSRSRRPSGAIEQAARSRS